MDRWTKGSEAFVVFILGRVDDLLVVPVSVLDRHLTAHHSPSENGNYKLHVQAIGESLRFRELPDLDLSIYRNNYALLGGVLTEKVASGSANPREFSVVIERDDEGYYVASVPALAGCHTQARSLDVLMERVREAIEVCLEVEDQAPAPLQFVGVQRVAVAV